MDFPGQSTEAPRVNVCLRRDVPALQHPRNRKDDFTTDRPKRKHEARRSKSSGAAKMTPCETGTRAPQLLSLTVILLVSNDISEFTFHVPLTHKHTTSLS